MKKKVFTTMMVRAAMTLLALFCFHGGANAQKSLPYEYGFENADFATEGWSTVDCDKQSKLGSGSFIDGHYLFIFHANNDHDQYLISPELDSSAPISVLFWYNSAENYKSAIFEVGYSTTTKDVSAFTWDLPRTHESLVEHPYANTYPAGTKYIAIKYLSFSDDFLQIDSFKFTQAAPVSLPYEFGFENYPEEEGWIRFNCQNYTDRWYSPSDAHTGNCSFLFSPASNNAPQCLITPVFSGNAEILMSFWYKGNSPFQIGYSTTTNDLSTFTWDEEITPDETWKQYSGKFTGGVKYIAFKYASTTKYAYLLLDDFCFEAVSEYKQPTDLTMADITSNTATVTWTKPASGVTGYYYQYRKNGASDWETERSTSSLSASLSELKPGTDYNFRVRACYGSGIYSNYATIDFTTDCGTVSVPYTESFEYGLACWSYVGTNLGVNRFSSISHEGEHGVIFYHSGSPQYLISPEFDSSTAMTMSFWYWKNYTDNPVTFQVGYSTTTNDVSAFTWGEEVSAIWGWEKYENDIPADTKFVAIKYTSTNGNNQLIVDDFSFVTMIGHYCTWLESCGSDYMAIVNVLKSIGLTLTEAQELANSAPCYVLTDVYEEEAQALANMLTAKGATAYAKDMREHFCYGTWLVSCGSDNTAIIDVLQNQLGIGQTAAQELADAAPCYVLKDVPEKEAKELAIALIANGAIAYAKDMTKHEGYATWLVSYGDSKMAIINELRNQLGLGLKEAKDLADAAPCMVLENVTEEEAQALANALIEKGATVYVEDLSGKTKNLPYTYGFENYNLEGEGWSLVDCNEGTNIKSDYPPHEGNYSFRFRFTSNPPQYLISPKLVSATSITMSFYYRNNSNDFSETFQVGYSTTSNSPDAFTWGNEVTANDKTTWKQYKTTFPKGTKYVAIKHTSNDQLYLFLDDFCFEEAKPKPLPYTYGFENNDLEGEGWSLVDCDEDSEIYNNEVLSSVDCLAHEGNNCFIFNFNSNPPQYLISPLLEGTTGVAVSFYYTILNEGYPETFQVGYSTTTNSPDAFSWGNEVTANNKTTWKQYKATFPEGTKYIAVKYTSYNKFYLFLDDFCFEDADGIILAVTEDNNDILQANKGQDVNVNFWGLTLKANMWNPLCLPFSMTAEQIAASPLAGATIHEYHSTQLDGTSATMNFISECTEIEAGHPYVVKFSGEDIVDPSFDNVYIPNYPVAVSIGNNDSFIKGTYAPVILEAGDKSKLFMQDGKLYRPESVTTVNAFSFYFELGTSYNNVTRFMVDYGIRQSLPYTYGFENNDLEGEGWSLVDCVTSTMILSGFAHEGNYGFKFRFTTNPPQYLISPQLEGTTGVAVSFYYKNGADKYPETFQVGYSTTTKSPDAFTWGNEVTANDETQWKQYQAIFPEGTKYVAVKHTSYDQLSLGLDDFSFTEATSILGDVNGDGLVDISDVVLLVNIILNDGNGGNQAADVNNDSHVDISDVVQLVNIILGS